MHSSTIVHRHSFISTAKGLSLEPIMSLKPIMSLRWYIRFDAATHLAVVCVTMSLRNQAFVQQPFQADSMSFCFLSKILASASCVLLPHPQSAMISWQQCYLNEAERN